MAKPNSTVTHILHILDHVVVGAEISRTDSAGLHFVVSTPAQTLDKHDRKAIRSHATKAGVAGRQTVQLQSWISPDRKLRSTQKSVIGEASIQEPNILVPSPRRVGTLFSGLQLPSGIEPYMIQDLVKLIELNKYGVYPYEVCFDVHIVERGWFPYMINDPCCLHSMMFSVRAFLEGFLHNQLSHLACLHYAQTLELLQARLNEFDKTSAISDSTIMVVITLASVADLTGNIAAVANHMNGLAKIVNLRGGVRALNTFNNLQVKVCRADLAYALLSGNRPRFLEEEISWDSFIADRGLIKCSHQPHEASIHAFAETMLDIRLYNVLRDLHTFSCISNLAYQTTRKLSPETYNEIMISALYRLTYLSFNGNSLQESIRTGLLASSSMMYLQRHFIGQPYDHLFNLYNNALFELHKYTEDDLPVSILLWLTMLLHVVGSTEPSPASQQNVWLEKAILRAGIDSWLQAREMLKSVVWVDFIFDRRGKKAFEAAISRLEGTVL